MINQSAIPKSYSEPPKTEREKLIKDIVAIMTEKPYMEPTVNTASVITDFIIADRKRIMQPLVKCYFPLATPEEIAKAKDETLKLAGEI